MLSTIYYLINLIAKALILVVIVDVVISYFVSPYNTIRIWLDRIVNPMLAPIRRFVPSIAGLDISPIILVIFIQVVASLIQLLLAGIG